MKLMKNVLLASTVMFSLTALSTVAAMKTRSKSSRSEEKSAGVSNELGFEELYQKQRDAQIYRELCQAVDEYLTSSLYGGMLLALNERARLLKQQEQEVSASSSSSSSSDGRGSTKRRRVALVSKDSDQEASSSKKKDKKNVSSK